MISVERVYRETGKLVEKYDVIATNRPGGGGEYPTQDGFGWTNGVMLKLMALYPADAEPRRSPSANVPAHRGCPAREAGEGDATWRAPAPLPALHRRPRHAPTTRRGGSR